MVLDEDEVRLHTDDVQRIPDLALKTLSTSAMRNFDAASLPSVSCVLGSDSEEVNPLFLGNIRHLDDDFLVHAAQYFVFARG